MPERYKMIYLLVRLYQILAELIEYEVQKVIYLERSINIPLKYVINVDVSINKAYTGFQAI